ASSNAALLLPACTEAHNCSGVLEGWLLLAISLECCWTAGGADAAASLAGSVAPERTGNVAVASCGFSTCPEDDAFFGLLPAKISAELALVAAGPAGGVTAEGPAVGCLISGPVLTARDSSATFSEPRLWRRYLENFSAAIANIVEMTIPSIKP